MLRILHSHADPAREPPLRERLKVDKHLIPTTALSHICYCETSKKPNLDGVHQGQCYPCSEPKCPAYHQKIAVVCLGAHQQLHLQLTDCPCECHDGMSPGQCESCNCPAESRRALLSQGFFDRCDAKLAGLEPIESRYVKEAQEMSRPLTGAELATRMTQ